MPQVRINCAEIRSWPEFHSVFAKAFGFPSYYGRNMDAWIDCMTDVGDSTAGTSRAECEPGECVTIILDGADLLADDVYETLLDLTAFVNWRRLADGANSVLVVAAQRKSQSAR